MNLNLLLQSVFSLKVFSVRQAEHSTVFQKYKFEKCQVSSAEWICCWISKVFLDNQKHCMCGQSMTLLVSVEHEWHCYCTIRQVTFFTMETDYLFYYSFPWQRHQTSNGSHLMSGREMTAQFEEVYLLQHCSVKHFHMSLFGFQQTHKMIQISVCLSDRPQHSDSSWIFFIPKSQHRAGLTVLTTGLNSP